MCDEPKGNSSSENQEKIYEKIDKLNDVLNQLFQRWANHLSQLRELSAAIIQFTHSSLPTTSDQLDAKISQILILFQTGAIIHCGLFLLSKKKKIFSLFFPQDLDKNYNDKLCLEYELSASPVHLTTTDECILAALRKLSSLEQQVKNIFESLIRNK